MRPPDYAIIRDPTEMAHMGPVNCTKVYVDHSAHGRGVFARQALRAGEVVETGIMVRLRGAVDGHVNPHLHTWSDDRTVWGAPSGCVMFYNHSDAPNVRKIGDLARDTIVVVALRDIAAGEELRSTYSSAAWRDCFRGRLCDPPAAAAAIAPVVFPGSHSSEGIPEDG